MRRRSGAFRTKYSRFRPSGTAMAVGRGNPFSGRPGGARLCRRMEKPALRGRLSANVLGTHALASCFIRRTPRDRRAFASFRNRVWAGSFVHHSRIPSRIGAGRLPVCSLCAGVYCPPMRIPPRVSFGVFSILDSGVPCGADGVGCRLHQEARAARKKLGAARVPAYQFCVGMLPAHAGAAPRSTPPLPVSPVTPPAGRGNAGSAHPGLRRGTTPARMDPVCGNASRASDATSRCQGVIQNPRFALEPGTAPVACAGKVFCCGVQSGGGCGLADTKIRIAHFLQRFFTTRPPAGRGK
ncbi:MAG: hypothetical protein BWX80_02078 [Candidatus Hydrogenedentes bacterium ADurb.Bin101]|nr:MAG: hypothetical protein BWX80_02078 [Candidatus Hydrogenedentes bacterium ADurb.Bin101]